jgi:phosphatidylserine decarboxylase
LDPIDSFKNFNEFFYRKLKPGVRTLASENKDIVVCPADARTNCFSTIKQSQEFWIKGSKFSLEGLLGSAELAKTFHEGSLAVCRLAPQDYHRFHWPVDGKLESSQTIDGTYFTVNPMAVRTTVDVFVENIRNISIIDSEKHGKVAYICVGAMLVGSIVITSKVGESYSRMDEHGYFKFGGSTIILLFEKGKVAFDTDLLSNSSSSLETLCKFGTSMGSLMKQIY